VARLGAACWTAPVTSPSSDADLDARQAALQAEAQDLLAAPDLAALLADIGPPLFAGSFVSGLMCWREVDVMVLAGPDCSPQDVMRLAGRIVGLAGVTGLEYRDERLPRTDAGIRGKNMKRFILTGAPGAGKTSILRALAAAGYPVVEEAATDVMARLAVAEADPSADPLFIDRIAALQRQRREAPVPAGATVQVHDRSAVCTLALARYLGHPVPPVLEQEIAWAAGAFDRRVFFVRLLGFIQPTAVRRISYAQSQAFERIHEEEYRRLGFHLVDVPAGTVAERAAFVMDVTTTPF
jgi:predicted ATPase